MARSSGSIHIADNSVTAINDAIQQLLFMIDEIRGDHDTTVITIGPHTHAASVSGGQISHDTGLSNVSADDHHTENHQSRHNSGGADAIKLDDLASPDDNTDLDASTLKHGLMQKYPADSSKYLDGSGSFSTVPGSSEAVDIAMAEGVDTTELWERVFSNDQTVAITKPGNGDTIDLSVTATGGGSLSRIVMLAGA